MHVPLPLVRAGLRGLELISGGAAFATWEEAELMEVGMTTERGPEDAKRLGVEPRPMADVLGANVRLRLGRYPFGPTRRPRRRDAAHQW